MSARGSAGFLALFDLDKQCNENTSAVRRHLLTGCSLVESGCDFDGRFLDAFLREDFDAAVDVGGQCGDVLRALVAQREEVPTDRFHIWVAGFRRFLLPDFHELFRVRRGGCFGLLCPFFLLRFGCESAFPGFFGALLGRMALFFRTPLCRFLAFSDALLG